jgi:RNA polymerase sigma-70 factor, ECF subfamily
MDRAAEHSLVRRARDGDEQAVEALIRAHQGSVYAFILRMSGRPEVAEDIVQEALVRVLSNLRRFDSRFRFSTWLFTIAKRLYMNYSQKLGPTYDSDAVDVRPGHEPGPGSANARRETMDNARRLLDAALAALPAIQREVILLFHQQGWPIAEIAGHLHLPQGTVKSHLHRGRSRMRRMIEASRQMALHVEEVWS